MLGSLVNEFKRMGETVEPRSSRAFIKMQLYCLTELLVEPRKYDSLTPKMGSVRAGPRINA